MISYLKVWNISGFLLMRGGLYIAGIIDTYLWMYSFKTIKERIKKKKELTIIHHGM